MLRRLGIRAKVMAVLAVPMLVIFGTGAFISYNALTQLRYANAAESVVKALQAYAPLASAIETERTLSLAGGTPEQLKAARSTTDAALAEVKPVVNALDFGEFPPAVVKEFQDVQFSHDTVLPAVRTLVDIKSQRAVILRDYSDIVAGQIALMEQVSNSFKNRDLATYTTAYREIADASDNLVTELIAGVGVMTSQGANNSLVRAYGTRTWTLLGDSTSSDALGTVFGADLTRREVDYLVREEWAETADDILWRRSKLGLRVSPEDAERLRVALAGDGPAQPSAASS